MKKSLRNEKVSYAVKIAIFASLSIVLYFIKIPANLIPIFPDFLDFQFSNLPAIIGGFILGPIGGILIVLIRTVIKLPFSSTMMIGELCDFLIGAISVGTSSLIYKYIHTKRGGVISLLVSTITWIVVAIFVNAVIIIPFYMKVFHMDASQFVNMLWFVKNVNENNYMLYYILAITIPFNLLLSIVVNVVTYFVYKRVSILMTHLDNRVGNNKEQNDFEEEKKEAN